MTTAVIGTGTLGSVIARLLASGGKTLRFSSADNRSARMLAAESVQLRLSLATTAT
jgi:predicted dinucleotide-binding enzyme